MSERSLRNDVHKPLRTLPPRLGTSTTSPHSTITSSRGTDVIPDLEAFTKGSALEDSHKIIGMRDGKAEDDSSHEDFEQTSAMELKQPVSRPLVRHLKGTSDLTKVTTLDMTQVKSNQGVPIIEIKTILTSEKAPVPLKSVENANSLLLRRRMKLEAPNLEST
jgi:hypothetical protein